MRCAYMDTQTGEIMDKFCKNCEYFGRNSKALQINSAMNRLGVLSNFNPTCKHPSLPKDLVFDGVISVFAHDMRKPDGDCGPEGKLFEPEIIEPPLPIRKWWHFWR